MNRRTPTVIDDAERVIRQGLSCLPPEYLKDVLDRAEAEANDHLAPMTKAQRAQLWTMVEWMDSGLRERVRNDAQNAAMDKLRAMPLETYVNDGAA